MCGGRDRRERRFADSRPGCSLTKNGFVIPERLHGRSGALIAGRTGISLAARSAACRALIPERKVIGTGAVYVFTKSHGRKRQTQRIRPDYNAPEVGPFLA